jgi:hypothetical protein
MMARIRTFRELVAALADHPALSAWTLFDGVLENAPPDPPAAVYYLQALIAEIRDRAETMAIWLNPGPGLFLEIEKTQALAALTDGLRLAGLDEMNGLGAAPENPADEILGAAFLGAMAHWLMEKPIQVEAGGRLTEKPRDAEALGLAGTVLGRMGLAGWSWPCLTDPEPGSNRLWPYRPGDFFQAPGLLNEAGEPKPSRTKAFAEAANGASSANWLGFIDLSPDEFRWDPGVHLARLWDHFRETHSGD